MTTFLIIAAVMLLLPLVVLARVFLGKATDAADDTTSLNVGIAKERLRELEGEHTKGELSDEEFAQAKQDLELALAQDLGESAPAQANTAVHSAGKVGLVVSALILLTVTVALYGQIGSPQHLGVQGPGQPASQRHNQNLTANDIEAMVAELEKRLEQAPDNPQGWMLLGRTHMKMERYAKAVKAFEKLNELLPNTPGVMLSLADATAMAHGGVIAGKSKELILQVLEIDPNDVTALWLAGQAEDGAGNTEGALKHWQKAYPLLVDEPEMQQQLASMIREAGGEVAQTVQPAPVQAAAPTVAAQPEAIPDGPGVLVQVAMDMALVEDFSDQDTIFVVAKAVGGPPMPLAVARKTVADLPIQVKLTDAMAMMPAMKISAFPKVEISARVSKSGQAIAQAGDVFSNKVIVASDSTEPVQLLIAR